FVAEPVKRTVSERQGRQNLPVEDRQVRLFPEQGREFHFLDPAGGALASSGDHAVFHLRRNGGPGTQASGSWRKGLAPSTRLIAVLLRPGFELATLEGFEHAGIEIAPVVISDLPVADRRDDFGERPLQARTTFG